MAEIKAQLDIAFNVRQAELRHDRINVALSISPQQRQAARVLNPNKVSSSKSIYYTPASDIRIKSLGRSESVILGILMLADWDNRRGTNVHILSTFMA